MYRSADLRLRLANERIARDHREAAEARLAARAQRLAAKRRHRLSLRRSVGHSMIELGRRIAAERPLNPVRSR
jgi:hypothetical protein